MAFGLSGSLELSTNYINSYGLPLSVRPTYNEGYVTYFMGLDPAVPRDNGTTASVFGLANYLFNGVTNPSALTQWVPLSLTAQLAGNGGATCYLRLVSPTKQMDIGFDQNYLFDANYGADWFTSVFQTFYNDQANPFYLDMSSLAANGTEYTTYHQSAISGNAITFTPDGYGQQIIVAPSTSQAFFSNAIDDFNVTTAEPAATPALLCAYLSSGFVAGFLPQAFPQDAPLSFSWLQQVYLADPGAFWGSSLSAPAGGPWYNLYGALFHELGPHVETNNYSNNDSNSADVAMGLFYTIPPGLVATGPYVTVTVGNMEGSVIPDFSDSAPYNVFFNPGPGANFLYGATTILGNSPAVYVTGATMPINLVVGYSSGSYSGMTYDTQIYMNSPTQYNYTTAFQQLPSTIAPSYGGVAGWWNIGGGAPN